MTPWIEPDWPALPGLHAACTLRTGGVSNAPWDSFNLAQHVGDDGQAVALNRARLKQALALPAEPCWLEQVHGTRVVEATAGWQVPRADAIWTAQAGRVCAVMVADCLPILLRDSEGRCIAAIHAGWRGLANGIVAKCVQQLNARYGKLRWQAWLGPCIGPTAFEVGDDVRMAFVRRWSASEQAFTRHDADRWLADLVQLARIQLRQNGVNEIWGGRWCTYTDPVRFFSYRRDSVSGRMAALIWRSAAESKALA